MKKATFFEDDGRSLKIVDTLREYEDWDIYPTCDWRDIMCWLSDEPGAKAFAALVFDLMVPTYKLPVLNGRKYDKDKDGSPSLYFINEYILKKFPDMKQKVIICSGFLKDFAKRNIDLSDFTTVDKYDDDYEEILIEEMNKLRG
jgi:hypothetical protein